MIVLHGKTQSGADMVTRTAWPKVAKREGFAVVFPDGLNHAWADLRPNNLRAGEACRPHGTDDVAFIAKLVEKLVADGSADPKRDLRHRHFQWRRHDHDAGLRARRSVCGGRKRDHEPDR